MGEVTSLLTPDQTALAGLLVMRLTGLLWTAPLFSAQTVNTRIKVVLLALLTFLMWPAAASAASPGLEFNAATLTAELAVGMTLGLGAAIFIGAAEAAGDMVAVQMGLSGANVLDPMSRTQLPVVGQFMGLFALALILSVGGHVVILGALARSLEIVPPGGAIETAAGIRTMIDLGTSLFVMGLRFAAPMIAAMLIANAALGVLARTTPQMNVLMVAFPVQIAVGLFMLAATLPMVASFFSGFDGMYRGVADDLLGSLAPTTGGVR